MNILVIHEQACIKHEGRLNGIEADNRGIARRRRGAVTRLDSLFRPFARLGGKGIAMNMKKLIHPIRVPMEVVLCAGILALHAGPARADSWLAAPPMPTPRLLLAAATGPDGTSNEPDWDAAEEDN